MTKMVSVIQSQINIYWQRYTNFILYSVIGLSGVFLDLVVFYVLHNFGGWEKNLANLISISCGIINNFTWNTLFNFKTKDKLILRFTSFYTIGLVGVAITAGLFWIFVDTFGFSANLIKVLSILPVVVTQYLLNKFISFRKFKEST